MKNITTNITKQDNNALARDRTVLANERTYQAWLRTGLSFFVTGLGIIKFLKEEMPLWIVITLTVTLIILSIASFAQATKRYCDLHFRLAHLDISAIPVWKVKLLSYVLIVSAMISIVGIMYKNL